MGFCEIVLGQQAILDTVEIGMGQMGHLLELGPTFDNRWAQCQIGGILSYR